MTQGNMDFYRLFILPWIQRLVTGYIPPTSLTISPFHFGESYNPTQEFEALKRSIEESEREELGQQKHA